MLLSSKKNEYYWSIVIEPGWVQAAVWTITGDKKTDVLAIGPSVHWDEETDLPNSADTSLSGAVQNLPEDAPEPSKTVFGVPPSWVEDGQIGKDHLEKIRELCSKLSLEPSGFVVLSEAIAHFKRTEEGTPLNAIIVGVGSDTIDITVFRLGTLTGSVNIARSVSPLDDVKEGLSKFASGEALPSRFLLYDGREGELEEVKQALIKGDWSGGDGTFLHTPQVEIIDPDKKVLAVCLAGAAEIGQATGLAVTAPEEVVDDLVQESVGEEHANVSPAPEAIKPEDFGFAVGKDLSQADNRMPSTPPPVAPLQAPAPQPDVPMGLKSNKITDFLRNSKLSLVSFFAKSGGAFTGSNIFLPGAIFLTLLLIGGFIAWWFLPKAEVIIYVSPQKLEEATTVFVDPKLSSPNLATRTIPGDVLKTTVSGDKTQDTTGTKTVGEKAKGTVRIRNGTASIINLASGATITASSDLKFTLDSSASVSASVSPTEPGTQEVSVTAADIGPEYNLAQNETFQVSNYPKGEVDALALSNFTGGSSREITAVSQEDRDKLEKDLKEELIDKAKTELKGRLTSEHSFIEDAVGATVSSRTFNRKVGDEAGNLKLSMTLEVSGLVANKSHLTDIARELLKDQAPGGFVLRDDQIAMEFDVEAETRGVWEVGVLFAANLLPEVKTDDIARAISGKYPNVVQSYLASIPGYVRAEIKFMPQLPGKLGSLPRVVKNITVEVAAER